MSRRRSSPAAWLVAATALALPRIAGAQTMRAHFIDVGQGNATLLEFSCGAIMIDAGGKDENTDRSLLDHLARVFERRPDLQGKIQTLFITHTHKDHNRALRALVEKGKVDIERYVHNGILEGSGSPAAQWIINNAEALGIETRSVADSEVTGLSNRRGLRDAMIDPLACKDVDPVIRVLSGSITENPGWSEDALKNGNNHSLVIRVDFGLVSMLFTGDLEEVGIETLVEYYQGTHLLDVDVYHVGHHGSYNGTTDSLLTAMSPRLAVISMSRWSDRRDYTAWAYGHPREHAVRLLQTHIDRRRPATNVHVASGQYRFFVESMTDAIYATGWDGTIELFAHSDGRMVVRRHQ